MRMPVLRTMLPLVAAVVLLSACAGANGPGSSGSTSAPGGVSSTPLATSQGGSLSSPGSSGATSSGAPTSSSAPGSSHSASTGPTTLVPEGAIGLITSSTGSDLILQGDCTITMPPPADETAEPTPATNYAGQT